jgi:hypothetical protein
LPHQYGQQVRRPLGFFLTQKKTVANWIPSIRLMAETLLPSQYMSRACSLTFSE